METKTTKKDIIDRLIGEYLKLAPDTVNTVEGSFTFDTLAANAVEFEKAYAEISLALEAIFPQTSWGEYLTMKAEEHGVIRHKATSSVVTLTITGDADANIPIGSIFATADGVNFITTNESTITGAGTADVRAAAILPGAIGNVTGGSITKIPIGIPGVNSVTNKENAYDGFDTETDAALLERLLFKVRQPATSGNVYHYRMWTMDVTGVGMCKIIPLWNGNGTVKVLVLDNDMQAASENLLERVRQNIENNRPIGATVTVAAPELLKINISFKTTDANADTAAIKDVLNAWLKSNAFAHVGISQAQVGHIILDNTALTGVTDYSDMLLNGSLLSVVIGAEQLPIIESVTVNE